MARTAGGGPKCATALVLAAAVPLALAGCEERPRAPALTNEAIYHNRTIGLRFLTPEGWALYAKSALPPGPADHPMLLAAYQRSEGQARGDLELYAVDLPAGQDLLAYLAAHPIGPDKWSSRGNPQSETINGAAATRYTQSAPRPKGEMRREIVAFRRPDRTYLFVLTHPSSDTQLREQARRSIESATWE